MDAAQVYLELYGRIPPLVRAAVEGMSGADLCAAPGPACNTVGWLVWHLTRVQDHHVSEVLDSQQVWTGGWATRFGLDPDPANTGFGHGPDEVLQVRPSGPEDLIGYYEAVHTRTVGLLSTLAAESLDRIVDPNWDPPVTLGVRLVSVADDCLQHAGQALYARGLVEQGWHLGY